ALTPAHRMANTLTTVPASRSNRSRSFPLPVLEVCLERYSRDTDRARATSVTVVTGLSPARTAFTTRAQIREGEDSHKASPSRCLHSRATKVPRADFELY